MIEVGKKYKLACLDTDDDTIVEVVYIASGMVYYHYDKSTLGSVSSLRLAVFEDIYKPLEVETHVSTQVQSENPIPTPKATEDYLTELCDKMNSDTEHPEIPISPPLNIGDPKARLGNSKMPFHHISPAALVNMSPQTHSGAIKYGLKNWVDIDKEHYASVYTNAVMRHLILFMAGQDHTSDSKQLHIDAIISGLTVYRDAIRLGTAIDDRVHYPTKYIEDLEKELETWEYPKL